MLNAVAPPPHSELNKVVELWRYPDATACMNARIAAREAPEWRAAIAKVAPMVQVRARKQPAGSLHSPSRTPRAAELQHAVLEPGGMVALAVAADEAVGFKLGYRFGRVSPPAKRRSKDRGRFFL